MIFSRYKVRKYSKFTLGAEDVEDADDYVYLGVTFNYNGSFRKSNSKQVRHARKAMFALLQKSRTLRLPVHIVCELFDKCVVPVLLYGAEVWGCENLCDVEIFHRNLRMLIKTFKFTPNCILYGEAGRTDMKTFIHQRIIDFWAKSKFGTTEQFSSILSTFLSKLQTEHPENYTFKWVQSV